jgi:Zn-dependent protease
MHSASNVAFSRSGAGILEARAAQRGLEGQAHVRGSLRIGRIFGIPITVNITWLPLLALVLSYLGTEGFEGRPAWVVWAAAIASALLFFASLVLHELGHSAVARYFGIPVRGITLFALGAVAQTTHETRKAGQEFLLAAAGPAVSILIAGVFMVVWLLTEGTGSVVHSVAWWLWLMNFSVGIFNLAPAYPMDGGRIFRAGLWAVLGNRHRATRWAALVGRGFALALIALGFVVVARWPVALRDFGQINGIQFILLGFFLHFAAGQSDAHSGVLDVLGRFRVSDVMLRDVPVALAPATTTELLAGPLAGYGAAREWLFVSSDDRFAGVVPRVAALAVPEERRFSVRAGDLAMPSSALGSVAPDEPLDEVIQRMDGEQTPLLVVVEGGQVTGLIHRGMLAALWQQQGARRG